MNRTTRPRHSSRRYLAALALGPAALACVLRIAGVKVDLVPGTDGPTAFVACPGKRLRHAHQPAHGKGPQQLHGALPTQRWRPATARAAIEADYAAAAQAAAGSAPAISVVVAAAATGSAAQLARAFGREGSAQPSGGGEEASFFGAQRWSGRTVAIACTWALLLGYSVLLAPGKSPEASQADQALLGQILSTPFDGSVPALFVCIFNMLGIWPAIYAATLLPGSDRQSPVPTWPFVAGSFFLGAFALSPYLAVREYRGVPGESGAVDWITDNVLESRLNAVLLLAGALYLALYALGSGNVGSVALADSWTSFLPLFMSSLTAHVSCIDFLVLWMLYGPVLLEDGRRRNCFVGSPGSWSGADAARFALGAGIPVFGGLSWLLLRPPLPKPDGAPANQ